MVGILSSGFVYAGKKAVAAEIEHDGVARIEGSKVNASGDGRQGLSYAPQFDGLECFETIVRTGKHPRTAKAKASGTEKSVPKNRDLAIAPQFDGLHCFETFISKQ